MIARGLLVWAVAATLIYVWLYVFNRRDRKKAVKSGRRMAVAGIGGLVAALTIGLLNNLSGL